MEKLLGSLSLGAIYRHFVSGAIFIAAYLHSAHGVSTTTMKILESHYWVLGISSLFIGLLIYALHRGLTNPLLESLRHWVVHKRDHPAMPREIEDMMCARWNYTRKVRSHAEHIFDWGDYVHLLYTSALALSLGSVVAFWSEPAWSRSGPAMWHWDWCIAGVAFVFTFAAFTTDCRKHQIEKRLYASSRPDYEI